MALDPLAASAVRALGTEIAALNRRLATLEAGSRTAGLKYSSIDGGALVVNDGTGTTRQVIGAQPDGTVTAVDANAPPPATPSAPLAAAQIGGLIVGWDGLLGGAAPLSDFLWTEVHVSPASGFTPSPATLARTMNAGGIVTVAGLTPGTTYYAALVAVNRSRTASPPSAQASATPLTATQAIPPFSIGAGLLQIGILVAGIIDGTVVTGSTLQNSSANPRTSINPDGSYTVTNAAGAVMFRIGPDGTIYWYDTGGNLLMQLAPGGTQAIYASPTGPAGTDFEPPSAPSVLFTLYSAAALTGVSCAVGVPVKAGAVITVVVSAAGATDATGVVDSAGNTYTLVQSVTAAQHQQVYQAIGVLPLGTADTITVALSAANTQQKNFVAVATTGVPLVSPLDFSQAASGTSAAPSVTGTPAAYGDSLLLIASWANAGGAGTTPDGWQLAAQANISGQQWTGIWYSANITAAAVTATAAITSAPWAAVLIGYSASPAQPFATTAPVPTNATLAPSTIWADDGAFSARVTKTGTGTPWGITFPAFPVKAGAGAAMRVIVNPAQGGAVALAQGDWGLTFWSGPGGTGTNLGSSSHGIFNLTSTFIWILTYSATAPAGAVSATAWVMENQADTAGNFWLVDNLSVPGGLAYSNSPYATIDALGNPVPQGISFVGLPGLTNVLGVTDPYTGVQLAGIDGQGNVSGQIINAATDVLIGGESVSADLAAGPQGVVTRGWAPAGVGSLPWPGTPVGTTQTPILELDVVVPAGRAYLLEVLPCTFIPTITVNTQMVQRLRMTTDGSTPTTSSAEITGHSPGVTAIPTTVTGLNQMTPYMEYMPAVPATDTQYRFLLCANIQNGTFQYQDLIEMRVSDVGTLPAFPGGVVLGTGTSGAASVKAYTEHFYGNRTWSYNEYGLRNTNGTLFQGAYSGEGYAQQGWIQWSLGTLGNQLNTVLNYTVSKVTLRLLCQHSWYNSGLTVSLHSSQGPGGSVPAISGELANWHATPGAFTTAVLGSSAWAPFKAAGTTYAVLRPPGGSLDLSYYGYFFGGGPNNANVPMITVSYQH